MTGLDGGDGPDSITDCFRGRCRAELVAMGIGERCAPLSFVGHLRLVFRLNAFKSSVTHPSLSAWFADQ